MTLTKVHIVDAVAEQIGYPKNQSTKMIETLLEIIKRTLESGEDVLVSRFGKFCVKTTTKAKAVTKKAPVKAAKITDTDKLLAIINRFKKGIDTATLMKKTGFNQKKVRNMLNRTYKQGKITRVEKGIYVGVK